MTLPSGWAEFNSDAVFRGRMDAASGTFSGTFSADAIEVVDTINVRNGAVSRDSILGVPASSWDYQTPPYSSENISGGIRKTYKDTFVVPPPQYPGSYLEIMIPFNLGADGQVSPLVSLPLAVARNGVSLGSETLTISGMSEYVEQDTDMEHYGDVLPFMLRILDMNPGSQPVEYELTYTIFTNTGGWYASRQPCWVEPNAYPSIADPSDFGEMRILISERLR